MISKYHLAKSHVTPFSNWERVGGGCRGSDFGLCTLASKTFRRGRFGGGGGGGMPPMSAVLPPVAASHI